jgi:hypothetical protein
MSVKIVDAALATHVATWLLQYPGVSGYHSFSTGTQMKMNIKVTVMTLQLSVSEQ